MNNATFATSWGIMDATWDKKGLIKLTLPRKEIVIDHEIVMDKPQGFLAQLQKELESYFEGSLSSFSLPFILPDRPLFYLKVWQSLRKIPFGHIVTYKELAALAGNEHAARAVGAAMRNNPLPLFIPCHRVIASDHSIGGFSGMRKGEALQLKKRLLLLEGHKINACGRLI